MAPRLRFCLLMRVGAILCFIAPQLKAACGDTDEDRLVWARERMHPSASSGQIELIYQWLANATRSCPQSGDLWYYRGLVARKLANASDATYAFRKADENGSKAKASGFDPFAVVPRDSSGPGGIRDKWALIIGVSEFDKSDDFLQYSGADANELGAFLVKNGHFKNDKSHVKVLVDKEATTEKIREAFGEIRAKAQRDDLVLVYLSSHGRPREMDPTGLSYVLTYDTDTHTKATTFATALKMVELAELGRWVLSRQYVLLLDACFSGAAQPGVVGKPGIGRADGLDPLQGLEGSGDRVVIAASKADERSYEDPESKHGYFTRFLLEALKQGGGQQQTLASLYEYLRQHVATEVGRQDNRQQHPVMEAFGQGKNIVLGAPLLAASLQIQADPPQAAKQTSQ